MKRLYIVFGLLVWSCLNAVAQDNSITAYGGDGAVFIYHAFHPASPAMPNGGITGYKLEREEITVPGKWTTIKDFHTPQNVRELVDNLRASFRFFPDGKQLRLDPPATWNKFIAMHQVLDSLSNELAFTPMQMAFNLLVADISVVKGKTYRYRVSEVGPAGGSYVTNSVKYPASVAALKPRVLSRHVESEAIRLEWFAINDFNSFNFKTFRRADNEKVFTEIHPYVYMERTGDSLKYSIRDEHVAFTTMYKYFIMPVNNFGGGGNVVSDTIPATCMEAKGILTPQFFRAAGNDATRSIQLHYRLPNPGLIGTVAVMRSKTYDDGSYEQVGLAMPYDSLYNDYRIEPGQKYYYFLQMTDKMGRTTVRSVKTFGLYQSAANDFPPRGVTATIKDNTVLINWEAPDTNPSGYYVYRSEGVGASMKRLTTLLPGTSYIDTSKLRSGVVYGYTVRSESMSNVKSKNSAIAYVQAAVSADKLLAPKNFHAGVDGEVIRLTWAPMAQANRLQTGYRITRRAAGAKQEVILRKNYPSPFNTFVDSSAVAGVPYIYNIESVAGNSYSLQVASNTVTATGMPYVPPAGLVALADPMGVKLKWGEINDRRVTRFAIYRYKRGEAPKLVATVPSTKNTYIDNVAVKGETWYFYIRSIGKNLTETSDKSNEAFISL